MSTQLGAGLRPRAGRPRKIEDVRTDLAAANDEDGTTPRQVNLSLGLSPHGSSTGGRERRKLVFDRGDLDRLVDDWKVPPRRSRTAGVSGPDARMEAVPTVVWGNPDPDRIGTSFIERQNLTIRLACRRFTRLCNGFSKKLENLKAALA